MTFVITQPCCNDATCVEVCPVDCIRPTPDDPQYTTAEMLYIDPQTCIDCGACADACPVDAIVPDHELTAFNERYRSINADYFDSHPLEPSVDVGNPGRRAMQSRENPIRVAIVGAGPSALYAATEIIDRLGSAVQIEIFDRLPTPWGLIRSGVAPDHPGTKSVTDLFKPLLAKKQVSWHLNVEVGRHLSHEELMAHHHSVIYAVGASTDRRLAIPGEDLPGSHAATEFVAWYNGHPDFADATFDLSAERAVIIGNGNVALDVARILVTDPEDLARTDIADHALEALRHSKIREVIVLGRRGPAQAAYTGPELIALKHLPGVDVHVDQIDLLAAHTATEDPSFASQLKVKVAAEYAAEAKAEERKRITLRFCASPLALHGNGLVQSIEIAHNELAFGLDGVVSAHDTGERSSIETGLVLRSIGYRGAPVPGVPFDELRGTIPNIDGRVIDPSTGQPIAGTYSTGWIKRGPSGVIGTNKVCAAGTVSRLIDDLTAPGVDRPVLGHETLLALLRDRQPDLVDVAGWKAIEKAEREGGRTSGRPRRKFVEVASMLAAASERN